MSQSEKRQDNLSSLLLTDCKVVLYHLELDSKPSMYMYICYDCSYNHWCSRSCMWLLQVAFSAQGFAKLAELICKCHKVGQQESNGCCGNHWHPVVWGLLLYSKQWPILLHSNNKYKMMKVGTLQSVHFSVMHTSFWLPLSVSVP